MTKVMSSILITLSTEGLKIQEWAEKNDTTFEYPFFDLHFHTSRVVDEGTEEFHHVQKTLRDTPTYHRIYLLSTQTKTLYKWKIWREFHLNVIFGDQCALSWPPIHFVSSIHSFILHKLYELSMNLNEAFIYTKMDVFYT